jgi:hypothetical protein
MRFSEPYPRDNWVESFHSLKFSPAGDYLAYTANDHIKYYNYVWLAQASASGGWQIPVNTADNKLGGRSLYHPNWVFTDDRWQLSLSFIDWFLFLRLDEKLADTLSAHKSGWGVLANPREDFSTSVSTNARTITQHGGGVSTDMNWWYDGQSRLYHRKSNGETEQFSLGDGPHFKGEMNPFLPDSTEHMDYVLGFTNTDHALNIKNRKNRIIWQWPKLSESQNILEARWSTHHNYVLAAIEIDNGVKTHYIIKLGATGNEVLKNDESGVLEAANHIMLLEYARDFTVNSVHLWVE